MLNQIRVGPKSTGLGQRLRALRVQRQWSQEDLASATGDRVDQTTISRIERPGGTKEPNVFDVAILAKALGITVEQLLDLPSALPVVATRRSSVTRAEFEGLRAAVVELQQWRVAVLEGTTSIPTRSRSPEPKRVRQAGKAG